jgi:hypothetical protein
MFLNFRNQSSKCYIYFLYNDLSNLVTFRHETLEYISEIPYGQIFILHYFIPSEVKNKIWPYGISDIYSRVLCLKVAKLGIFFLEHLGLK